MTSTTQDEMTVEFGALEQRGLLLGVSGASLATAAAGVLTCLLMLFVVGGGAGLMAAIVALAGAGVLAFVPVHGNPLAEWLGLLVRYLARAVTGRTSWRSGTPSAGVRANRRRSHPVELPEPLRQSRTRVVGTPYVEGDVGVILDGPLAIGVLKARAASAFLMKQAGEQAAATSEWADIIGSIADPGSPWVRLQWRDTTTPVDSGALVSFLAEAMSPEARVAGTEQHNARTVYERLLRTAAPVSESHEILLAVAMDPRRVARQVKDAGGGDRGTAAVLVRQLEQFAYKLAAGDILVEGMLSPRQVGQVIREQADPGERAWQSQAIADGEHDMAGVNPETAWPLGTDEAFSAYRTDGAWHATLWVKEWPRRPRRIDFLAPLLLRSGSVTRTVSVTMAPVDPTAALRHAEDAVTSDESDDTLRARWGVRTSGRRRREAAQASRREEELLDGYDDVRFSGYVTVSAPSRASLEEAITEVMAQARAAQLRLVRLVGQQPEAFWFTAPLCRGVR